MAESLGKLFSESLKLKEKEKCKNPQISQGLQLFVAVQISVIKKITNRWRKKYSRQLNGGSPINMKFLYTNLPVYQVVSHSRVCPSVALLTCFFLKYNFVVFLSASICCDTE